MPRVAAIAIDAAERAVIERFLDAGQLPRLAAIRDRSARCQLRNSRVYTSDVAWTQFLSGKGGAANGHWGLSEFDPRTYRACTGGSPQLRPFYAFGPDRKVIALDLPHSILHEDVAGAQVTAWGAHAPQYPRAARPQGLLREIDARFGTHPAFENDYDTGWYEPSYVEALGGALAAGAPGRLEIGGWLCQQVPDWELFVTCLGEFHSAAHHFWHGVDAGHPLHAMPTATAAAGVLTDVARALDTAIGDFVDDLPTDTNVVVFALHGMQAANDVLSVVLLPELLHRLQFKRPLLRDPDQRAWRQAGCPPVTPDSDEAWAVMELLSDRFVDGPRHWARRARKQLRRALPAPLYAGVRRLARQPRPRHITDFTTEVEPETDMTLEEISRLRGSLEWQPTLWYASRWPRMRAFALPTFDDGHIRINLKGRERDGIVDPADYRRAGEEVVAQLARCTDARTGRPVVEDVVWMREADPMADGPPDADLIVKWAAPSDAVEHPDLGLVGPVPHLRTGQHSPRGFALFSGPGIRPVELGERHALDLTPTILGLLGEAARDDIDGTSLVAEMALHDLTA